MKPLQPQLPRAEKRQSLPESINIWVKPKQMYITMGETYPRNILRAILLRRPLKASNTFRLLGVFQRKDDAKFVIGDLGK